MKTNFALLSIFYLLIGSTGLTSAKDWRGIIPLHSTREDVIRLLGPSPDANQIRSKYFLENEDVYIVFASSEDYFDKCVKQLPAGTVLLIAINPKAEMRLSDLHIDEKRFRKFDASDPPGLGFYGYVDEEDGLVVRTYNGKIEEINYIATAKDKHLCPNYYANPEQFIHLIVDPGGRLLDEYGDIRFNDEKARLDNYAIELQNNPTATGEILAYGACNGEGQARADCAKNYLVTTRGIDAARITTVDGGCRAALTVQLWLVPPGVASPAPDSSQEVSPCPVCKSKARPK